MKTYSTYQEAKIANPECEIVRWNKSDEYKAVSKSELSGYLTTWCHCNPTDYCMTVKQFLDDGHKFVGGDLFINASLFGNGLVVEVGLKNITEEVANEKQSVDVDCYILRAAALEKPKQISDTAREVFSGGEKRTKVDYVKVKDSIWSLEGEFKCGELYNKSLDCSGSFVSIKSETVLIACAAAGNVYRRIETPMTEREAFIHTYAWAVQDDKSNVEDIAGMLFDSGKFKLVN